MAILSNGKFYGFLCSVKETGRRLPNGVKEYVEDFVSGVSGWVIDKLGNAEFKSVFVRDKFITNEFVYNRIKVTEDEEIISSSMKIASYIANEDGTYSVYPDLREGDYNPLTSNDLLIGYYHNPGNSEVVYTVQKFKAITDPSKDDQSMILEPEGDSIPYQHMTIVHIGNTTDEERQSFIRISSRTNCQYFFDGIDSWAAYDDPEHVKCTLGHADIGLIPGWAKNAIEGVKRWFGLIADGVIIRGTFILHNDRTIEDELNSRETQIRSDFQIREDGITGKWQEAITYAEQASQSASSAADVATAAGEHEKRVEELVGEFSVNAQKLSVEFSEKVSVETSNALGAITTAKDEATGSLNLTAKDFTLAFSKQVETETEEVTGAINTAKETAQSELQLTAKDLTVKFEQSFTDAEGDIIKEIGTQVSQNANRWKVEIMGADENGNPLGIIAGINASKEGVTIEGRKINLQGVVTMTSLDSDLQTVINSKANSDGLGGLAFKDAVEAAQLGSTIIVGGYLNTDLIKVRRIDADSGFVGGFTIDSGRLYWKSRDYFGSDSRSLKLGVSQTDTEGIVDVSFNAATQGRFGVKAVGANLGGAAIYASSKSSGQSHPISANSYAGYFDGGVHVNGNIYTNVLLSNEYGTGWNLSNDGTYTYRKGVTATYSWNDPNSSGIIISQYKLEVVNGIVVGFTYSR